MASIQGIYVALFGRPADPSGLRYFDGITNHGANLAAIGNLSNQPEYISRFGGMSSEQIIKSIYQSLFNRDPEPSGLSFFAGRLQNGSLNSTTIAIAILDGALGGDRATVNAKIAAADAFTAALDMPNEIAAYVGNGAAAQIRAYLAKIGFDNPATASGTDSAVLQLLGTHDTGGSAAPTPLDVQMTSATETFTGSAANDKFTGDVNFSNANPSVATGSFNATDHIDGGAGIDALNLTVSGGGTSYTTGALPAATITNVEKLNIHAVQVQSADIVTVDASHFTGLTELDVDRSTSVVNVSNLATGASVGVIGDGTTLNGNVTFGYATATDAVALNLSGGTTQGTVSNSGSGATVATVNSTGAANKLNGLTLSASASITSLTIKADADLKTPVNGLATSAAVVIKGGAASVDVGTLNVSSIDASGLTSGGVTLALGASTTSFKGGQGNDTVQAAAIATTTASAVDAGAGTGDRLLIAATSDVNTVTKAALYANFEVLDTVAQTVDASLFTNSVFTGVRVGGAATISNLTVTQAANVTIYGSGASSLGLANASGGGDAVKASVVNSSATGAATAIDLTGIALPNIETLELTGNGTTSGNSGAITLTTTNALALNSIKLQSAGTSSITIDAAHTASGLTVDASDSSGAATINASAYNAASDATLIGGSGNDSLIGSVTRGDTLSGGNGNDTFYGDGRHAEVQTITIDNMASASGSITINAGAAVATSINAGDDAAAQAATVAANASLIKLANPDIASITSSGNVITITYKLGIDPSDVVATASGGANGGANTLTVATTTDSLGSNFASDTLTGGLGNDNFVFGKGAQNVAFTDSITDLDLGTGAAGGKVDTLTFSTPGDATAATVITLSGGQLSAASGAGSLAAATSLVAAAAAGMHEAAMFTYASDSYLFFNGHGDGTLDLTSDQLVKITGVSGTLDASDIVVTS